MFLKKWKISNGAVDFGYNGVFNSLAYGAWNIGGGQVLFCGVMFGLLI